tara:strand:+ start:51617 stop:52699 length:1083 start_codon:yes stop_codon:yes gene_type:complete
MKKLNVAILGCGRVAGHHALAINSHTGLNLISVCDFNKDRLDSFQVNKEVKKYQNYYEMMEKNNEIDIVAIVTPSGMHFEHAVDIIDQYKKHLVIEKPIVMNPNQGLKLKNLSIKNNVNIFPSHQYRFNKCAQRIKKGIENNELGKVFLSNVRMRWCRTQDYYDRDAWRGTYSMDGGCLTNQGIHHLDLLRYFMGEVKKVNSIMKTNGSNIEVEDTAIINIEFESGAIGIVEITTAARPKDFESSLSIMGDKGLAMLGGWATDKLITFSPDPNQENLHSDNFESAYGFGHNEIYDGAYQKILGSGPEAITLDDALKTITFLHAAYKSDEDKSWINISDFPVSKRLGRNNEELLNIYRIKR